MPQPRFRLVAPEQMTGILARRSAGTDLALIEGVMGLFDGYGATDDTGSSAHIARLTATPVIIVLDARAMARTAAALIAGLRDFDRRLRIGGVILNRVGSPRHAALIRSAIEQTIGVPVLGFLERAPELTLPERHLGLIPVIEPGRWQEWLSHVADRVAATIDLDHLLNIARTAPRLLQRRCQPFHHLTQTPNRLLQLLVMKPLTSSTPTTSISYRLLAPN